MLLKPILPR